MVIIPLANHLNCNATLASISSAENSANSWQKKLFMPWEKAKCAYFGCLSGRVGVSEDYSY